VLLHIGQLLLHCSPKRNSATLLRVTGASSAMHFLSNGAATGGGAVARKAVSTAGMVGRGRRGRSEPRWRRRRLLRARLVFGRRERRTPEATVELFGDDFAHVLRHQADDQIDDALLATLLVLVLVMRLQ